MQKIFLFVLQSMMSHAAKALILHPKSIAITMQKHSFHTLKAMLSQPMYASRCIHHSHDSIDEGGR